ncbi:MAG TPA: hypothetical protein VFW87_11970 [Pirellulales bacterium]|nr:hypothetical protein [Pirellulales bacterium]
MIRFVSFSHPIFWAEYFPAFWGLSTFALVAVQGLSSGARAECPGQSGSPSTRDAEAAEDERRIAELSAATGLAKEDIGKPRQGVRFTISVNKHAREKRSPLSLDLCLENSSDKRAKLYLALGGQSDTYHVIDRASGGAPVITQAGQRRLQMALLSFYGASMSPKGKTTEFYHLTPEYDLKPGHEYLVAVTRVLGSTDKSLSGPVISNVLSIKVPQAEEEPNIPDERAAIEEMAAATNLLRDDLSRPRNGVRLTISRTATAAKTRGALALDFSFENLSDTRKSFSLATNEATDTFYVIQRDSGKAVPLSAAGRRRERLIIPDFYGYSVGPQTSTTDLVDLTDFYDLEAGQEYLVAVTRVLRFLGRPSPEPVTSNVLSIKVQPQEADAACP